MLKTMEELLEKLKGNGYDVRLQENDLGKYRKAIKDGKQITAQRKYAELCAAVRMLISLNMVNGKDAWEIMEKLKEEGDKLIG